MLALTLLVPLTASATILNNTTLAKVVNRGVLHCGIHTNLPGFASLTSQSKWEGLDVDVCRAIAAAVLKDANKVKYYPLDITQRFTALQQGEVDVLARNVTLTMSRDSDLKMSMTAINFYDFVGFMTHKKYNVKSTKELKGATVCSLTGAWTVPLITDYFNRMNINFSILYFDKLDLLISAYKTGRCNVYANDVSQIAIIKSTYLESKDHVILPDVAFKSPLGPMVRNDDDNWRKLVTWVHLSTVTAEELGVTSKNVDQSFEGNNEVARLLGRKDFHLGKELGLDKEWAYRVIKQVGNFEEIYNKNVGKDSNIKLDRGINNIWSKGGLHYAPIMH
jgi:general L-amino acid transport system substrate-binding protein